MGERDRMSGVVMVEWWSDTPPLHLTLLVVEVFSKSSTASGEVTLIAYRCTVSSRIFWFSVYKSARIILYRR